MASWLRFPWVSRLAFDVVVDECERLRSQNGTLVEALTRLRRAETGLSETPKAPRAMVEPIPADVLEYCNAFLNPSIRKQNRDTVIRRRASGESWAAIRRSVLDADGVVVDEAEEAH